MKCDCRDCAFRGAELCEHRKLLDEIAALKSALTRLVAEIEPCIGRDANGLAVFLCEAGRLECATREAKELISTRDKS